MSDQVRCTICLKPVEARQTVVFQADGQLAHVTCLASTRKPLTRLMPDRAPDPACAACSKPISLSQSIIKGEAGFLHVDCFLDRRASLAATTSGMESNRRRSGPYDARLAPVLHRGIRRDSIEVQRAPDRSRGCGRSGRLLRAG